MVRTPPFQGGNTGSTPVGDATPFAPISSAAAVGTFANLGDVLFANSVEFWTGKNPITAKLEPKTAVGEDGAVARLVPVGDGARIEVVETSGVVRSMTLRREAPGVVGAHDQDGRLVRKLVGLGSDETRIVEMEAGR